MFDLLVIRPQSSSEYFGNNTKVEVIGDGVEWLNVTSKKLTGWSKKSDFRDAKANEDTSIQIAK